MNLAEGVLVAEEGSADGLASGVQSHLQQVLSDSYVLLVLGRRVDVFSEELFDALLRLLFAPLDVVVFLQVGEHFRQRTVNIGVFDRGSWSERSIVDLRIQCRPTTHLSGTISRLERSMCGNVKRRRETLESSVFECRFPLGVHHSIISDRKGNGRQSVVVAKTSTF